MDERSRIGVLALTMGLVALVVGAISVTLPYRAAFEQTEARLTETARSQSRLMEAMARYDAESSQDYPGGPAAATLSQIRDAHQHYGGLGKTGEFTLARLEGDQMVFLLSHRHSDQDLPQPVLFDSELAEPMRRSLSGLSGTFVGLDYRGVMVLAAHEPVAELDLGIVAKIDLAEVRAPFVKTGLIAALCGLVAIAIGAALFVRATSPLLRRLEEGELRYRTLFETMTPGVVYQSANGDITEANSAAERILGLTIDQMQGRSSVDPRWRAIHEDGSDFPGSTHPAMEALRRGTEVRDTVMGVYNPATEDYSWININAVPLFGDDGGRPERVYTIIDDITERRQAEEALRREYSIREAEAAIRLLGAEMDEPHDLFNMLGEISSRLVQLGVAHDSCGLQIVNTDGTDFMCCGVRSGDDVVRWGTPDKLPLTDLSWPKRTTNVEDYPWVLDVWRSGESHYQPCTCSDSGMPEGLSLVDVPFSHGTLAIHRRSPNAYNAGDIQLLRRLAGLVSSGFQRYLDITDRKRLEQEVIHLERMRVSGELAAGVSHNLNNMLTAVLGPAQLLLRKSDDPEIRRESEAILSAGQRARDLVMRLNQAVRVDREASLGPVSLNEQVHQVIQMSRPRWKDEPEARGVSIEVIAELGEIPDIRGNPAESDDAILNLIINAVDAMPEGGTITITTRAVGAGVQLAVSDTGTGMDEETLRRVFEPFFTTKMDIGSGLGLSTVHGTVARWGGTIQVDSTPGEGTTFTLYLPAETESATPEETPTAAPTPVRSGRLLIVEDAEEVCDLLDRLFSENHTVARARDGREALELFVPGQYDVALIDLGMPGLAGDQVAAEMKSADSCLTTILITGWPLAAADPRRSDFDFHLNKPFDDLDEVESVVAQAIGLHDSRA